jgi:hypothetical protein
MTDREPVSDAIDHVIDVLTIIAAMATKADTYDEVAAEERRLGYVISRANLILKLIDANRPSRLRVMQ